MLGVEGQELLHVGEGTSLLDVEAAPGTLADSEVTDLPMVANCGEKPRWGEKLSPCNHQFLPTSLLTHTFSPLQALSLLIHPKATQLTPGVSHLIPIALFAPTSWLRRLLAMGKQSSFGLEK